MRVAAFVSPNSSPKMAATRSNSAEGDEAPVEPADDEERCGENVEDLHAVHLLLNICTHDRTTRTRSCQGFVQTLYSAVMSEGGLLRIGELSRRSGVSPELLRAWERRYGLLAPTRSPGGLRLYSADDLGRVRKMQQHLAGGLAAAEAAALAARSEEGRSAVTPPANGGTGRARSGSRRLRRAASTVDARSTPLRGDG